MKNKRRSANPDRTGLVLLRPAKTKRNMLLGLMAMIVVSGLTGVRLSQLEANDSSQASKAGSASQSATVASDSSTNQPADNHQALPAELPFYMSIAGIGVQQAQVVPLGIEPSGEMAAPDTNHEVGWYQDSSLPGQSGGALLMNGHVGVGSNPAIFAQLDSLATGDEISIQNRGGETFTYTVYHVEQMALEKVDMRKMMRSVDPSRQGLNIITCAGEYDSSRSTYDDRVLVYAVRSS